MLEIVRNETQNITPECLDKLSGSADIKVVAVIENSARQALLSNKGRQISVGQRVTLTIKSAVSLTLAR